MSTQTPFPRREGSWIHKVPWVAVALLSCVSFTATCYGFHAIFSGASQNEIVAWGLAGLATTAVQLLLVYSVFRHKSDIGRLARLRWLIVYIVVAFVSVTFGIGFWHHTLESRLLAREDRDRQLQGLIITAEHFVRSYTALTGDLSHLSEHSATMAELESTVGGSCGYPTPGVPGPRTTMRNTDSTRARMFSDYVNAQQATVTTHLDTMKQLAASFDENQMDLYKSNALESYAHLRVVRDDPKLDQLRGWLTVRLDQANNGFEMEGKKFECPDPVFEQTASDVLASVEGLPDVVDPAEQDVWDPHDPSRSVELVLEKVLVRPIERMFGEGSVPVWPAGKSALREQRLAQMRASGQAEVEDARALPVLPIALGAVIDLLIFLATVPSSGPRRRSSLPVLPDVMESVLRVLPDDMTLERLRAMIFDGVKDSMDVGGALDERYMRVGGRDYIRIEPQDQLSDEDTVVRRLMDFLVLADKASVISDEGPFGVRKLLHANPGAESSMQRRPWVWLLSKDARIEEIRIGVLSLGARAVEAA